MDEIFNKLRQTGKMSRSRGSPYGWGVFVIRRPSIPGDKGRVVINTCGLNIVAEDNAYPLPRQEDLLKAVKGNRFIAIFDQLKSYYQRLVAPESRKLTTVVTHRGQEQFNVMLMGFKGSPPHQQRYMDELLEEFEFALCYLDGIVIASRTFEEHMDHIAQVLEKMRRANLALNPKKCSIGFAKIQLLGHLVDQYGLATLEAKIAAIREMDYPETLAKLDYFLGLTGFYRQYVEHYAQKSKPLKQLKTKLVKKILNANGKRSKKDATLIKVPPPSAEELESFKQLKEALSSERFLIHDDPDLPLLISIDTSYEFGFGVVVYQVPRESMEQQRLTIDDIYKGNYDRRLERVIMFISREITPAESRY